MVPVVPCLFSGGVNEEKQLGTQINMNFQDPCPGGSCKGLHLKIKFIKKHIPTMSHSMGDMWGSNEK
jgi:hypothetical protein